MKKSGTATSGKSHYHEPLRYVATRVKKKQGELFADGSEAKYFAVATNLWDCSARRLLEWHRESRV